MSIRTTEQWWKEVSENPTKMIDWLKDQFHGERTAALRIAELIRRIPNEDTRYDWRARILRGIQVDEVKHSVWIANLLESRNIVPEILNKEERYWDKTLPEGDMQTKSFEHLCAVGHLAEVMRLERIKLLATDTNFLDIAEVFAKILPDEEFHAKLFGILSTPEAIEEARSNHVKGMNALGLLP